jgi:hypothetical protein
VEVPAAEAVGLVPYGLHLYGVGEWWFRGELYGEYEASSAVRDLGEDE